MIARTAPLLLLLAGCAATPAGYPSLAPRPIEGRALFSEPERAETAGARDPALEAKVAAALAQVQQGERDFADALAAAQRLPAGAARGSEAWIAAQQALTVLDAARQPVAAALADLESLRLEAAQRAQPVDTAALDTAFDRAGEAAARQRASYDAAAARFPAA